MHTKHLGPVALLGTIGLVGCGGAVDTDQGMEPLDVRVEIPEPKEGFIDFAA